MEHGRNVWLFLACGALGCSAGKITDAETGAAVGGATVSFRKPNMNTSYVTNLAGNLGAPIAVKTWSASDPGVGAGAGTFYLNPYASLTQNDADRPLYVDSGWQRITVEKPGYDTRHFYREHIYTDCTIAAAQGPYSAGPYPYVSPAATPVVPGKTLCTTDTLKLHKSSVNYVREPDLMVDPRGLGERVVSTDCDGLSARCLRVTVGTPNVGEGDLLLLAKVGVQGVTQRRFRRDGSVDDVPLANANFAFHAEHDHIHLDNWTHLRLRQRTSACNSPATASACPLVGSQGNKISYCIEETNRFDSTYTKNGTWEASCLAQPGTNDIVQGIGAGWSDTYWYGLPRQHVSLDGVPAGNYWLEVEVNPADSTGKRTVIESDYSNNITRLAISL